jgi:hypothetical protein
MTPHVSRFTFHVSRSQRGVALVVTLLLLSIITFMTVTFLVVSRSQKGSVVTETEQANARLAADTALENAKAALLTFIMGSTNEFNYGLLASTNYINSAGFLANSTSPLNVNYDRKTDGSRLSTLEWEQNIANLVYSPRPPVFITNRFFANSNEFRFYLDLNRNGRYDTNGLQPVISSDPANPFYNSLNGTTMPTPQQGVTLSNFFVGDPEWIGSLERPEFQHSADNRFVNRYAYIAIPAGNTLDLNFIHNQAALARPTSPRQLNPNGTDFVRDQGVGTWEINLAAFLADLNTNLWYAGYRYGYDPVSGFSEGGTAFPDAVSLLAYRYPKNWAALASVSALFSNRPSVFNNDGVDGYTTSVQLNTSGFLQDPDSFGPGGSPRNLTSYPWPGADNPNHYYTTQELFDDSKTAPFRAVLPPPTFSQRLWMASTNNDSYNRNTFYRLLSQLGTDSAPEPAGKLNINYRNVDDYGNVVPGMATNFFPWTPEGFFTNAAIRLLANAGYTAGAGPANLLYVDNRGVTNLHIPLWPTNFYTASVHHLLQLAANIYDATTNRTFTGTAANYPYLPSVFRPLFGKNGNQIFIAGYQEVQNANVLNPNQTPLDLTSARDRGTLRPASLVWGVPIVVGAKKGFPNFNKFAMRTAIQATRKLEFVRQNNLATTPIAQTNQMYVLSISNVFGLNAWNSYSNYFPRGLQMKVRASLTACLSNVVPGQAYTILNMTTNFVVNPTTNILGNTWPGYVDMNHSANSVKIPLWTGFLTLTNSQYLSKSTPPRFVPYHGQFSTFERPSGFAAPSWWLSVTNRLLFTLEDVDTHRIVDCVSLSAGEAPLNITQLLATNGNCGDLNATYNFTDSSSGNPTAGAAWCTNRGPGVVSDTVPTFGVLNQIGVGQGAGLPPSKWSTDKDNWAACDFFRAQFPGLSAIHFPGKFAQTNTFYAPYVPTRTVYYYTAWQANDPLVHYTIPDLTDLLSGNKSRVEVDVATDADPMKSFGTQVFLNDNYRPWGGNPKKPGSDTSPPTKWVVAVKDPVIARNHPDGYGHSDDWDFPTNKLPNLGWLGRVHRGTPWQTLYLKSPSIDINAWTNWAGCAQEVINQGQFATNRLAQYVPGTFIGRTNDAYFSHPTNDWHILDLFTTAINDNATRGQLSINQTNLAAWSAVLSGVFVFTNSPQIDGTGRLVPTSLPIPPAGIYDPYDPSTWKPLARIVNGIIRTRANTNIAFPVFPSHSFQSLGDILAVPELTVLSPFVNTNLAGANDILNDAACERIPQQILGLLKCDHTPRFLVYSFGQALKPADHSLVTSGPFTRLCTNYQIMAEAATRAVVRVDGAPTNSHIVIESFNVLPPD